MKSEFGRNTWGRKGVVEAGFREIILMSYDLICLGDGPDLNILNRTVLD